MSATKKSKDPPGILDWLVDFFVTPIKNAIVGLIAGLMKETVKSTQPEVQKPVKDIISEEIRKLQEALKTSSPITPEAALKIMGDLANTGEKAYTDTIWSLISMEAASLGMVDISISQLLTLPSWKFWLQLAGDYYMSKYETAFKPFLRRYWMREYTPLVPPGPDLIQMVVREAFVPEMVVEAPKEFTSAMAEAGYDKTWCDRYWTAHFVPIALRQGYENLWRGYWDKEKFMRMLHIADIHPMWREDIYKVAFLPPSIREMGYGYDTGLYEVEDIVKYRRWGGLAPEDAEKAGRAMVAYRTEAEREALRREAIADYVAGLDDEGELRDKLAQIGGRPEIIELWVSRAKYRAERDLTLDLAKISVTDFLKGRIKEDQLRQDLIELGIVPERREALINEAVSRRAKTIREEKAEQKKVLPVARVRQARDLGLIGDSEYVKRLMEHDYTEEDARLDLAIELTPRPITPEEVERRKRTVEAKRNRAIRRYETRLMRLQTEIENTVASIEDTEVVMKESLDVLDAQIALIDEDLPAVTPERAEVLRKRRVVMVQRREAMAARFETRIKALTKQRIDLEEEKTLTMKHRDEELAEYEEELKLLGVAG